MARRILITIPRAQREIATARALWREHREKAPLAFDSDLDDAFTLILQHANAGIPVRNTNSGRTRRLYIERISYYLYYEVSDSSIIVVKFRHSARWPPPRL